MTDNEFTPFGKLSRDEKIALFAAWMDGKTIELRSDDGNWLRVSVPTWNPESEYRVAPTKPSIDWSHVAPGWRYLATDPGRCTWLHADKPSWDEEKRMWVRPNALAIPALAHGFSSFVPGTCDWKDSLVERPE